MGLIGFIDDYLKTIKKMKKGLMADINSLDNFLRNGTTIIIYSTPEWSDIRTVTSIPFLKNTNLDFGKLYL